MEATCFALVQGSAYYMYPDKMVPPQSSWVHRIPACLGVLLFDAMGY